MSQRKEYYIIVAGIFFQYSFRGSLHYIVIISISHSVKHKLTGQLESVWLYGKCNSLLCPLALLSCFQRRRLPCIAIRTIVILIKFHFTTMIGRMLVFLAFHCIVISRVTWDFLLSNATMLQFIFTIFLVIFLFIWFLFGSSHKQYATRTWIIKHLQEL